MEYLVTIDQLAKVVLSYIGDMEKRTHLGRPTWFNNEGKPLFVLNKNLNQLGIDEDLYYDIQGLLNLGEEKDDSMLWQVLDKLAEYLIGNSVSMYIY
jgi:hypothetical protein